MMYTAEDWETTVSKQEARIAELEEALRWLVYLGDGVGKAGGRPEPGEWGAALDQSRKVLDHEQR